MWVCNSPDKVEKYRQAKCTAARTVTEAKTWGWEKFRKAMEEEYQLTSKKFWQTDKILQVEEFMYLGVLFTVMKDGGETEADRCSISSDAVAVSNRCGEEGAESKDKALNLPLVYVPTLTCVINNRKDKITDTSVLPQSYLSLISVLSQSYLSDDVTHVSTESVRLVSGSSLCSGSVQIRNQSWDQSWTWLCEGALDLLGAEVLCRELGCGAPSLLQGALSPLGLQTFHCEGNESALMDCPRSSSRTCSSEAAAKLTCSEPLRLVGGASRCAGAVELKHDEEWRRVTTGSVSWILEDAAFLCRALDCGSAVSARDRRDFPDSRVWWLDFDCVKRNSASRCVWCLAPVFAQDQCRCGTSPGTSPGPGSVKGLGPVGCRGAVQGAGLWGSFSPPGGALSSGLQTFHCEGNESALMDCPRSSSRTCSSEAAAKLTCSGKGARLVLR
ncbi:hypothetical protein WMY93_025630 [Mugilogobius chulae]|uniref:SRCR domain-containing protein n=1 Tax=Mugilogobius chulae TaxID=88201 RepID=A0AAW0MYP7_9GOBI